MPHISVSSHLQVLHRQVDLDSMAFTLAKFGIVDLRILTSLHRQELHQQLSPDNFKRAFVQADITKLQHIYPSSHLLMLLQLVNLEGFDKSTIAIKELELFRMNLQIHYQAFAIFEVAFAEELAILELDIMAKVLDIMAMELDTGDTKELVIKYPALKELRIAFKLAVVTNKPVFKACNMIAATQTLVEHMEAEQHKQE